MKRIGNYISIAKGITAVEGYEGNLNTLRIRKNGKPYAFYRGSSLVFCKNLTDEDQDYLKSLANIK